MLNESEVNTGAPPSCDASTSAALASRRSIATTIGNTLCLAAKYLNGPSHGGEIFCERGIHSRPGVVEVDRTVVAFLVRAKKLPGNQFQNRRRSQATKTG